jgi:hypothetical protein
VPVGRARGGKHVFAKRRVPGVADLWAAPPARAALDLAVWDFAESAAATVGSPARGGLRPRASCAQMFTIGAQASPTAAMGLFYGPSAPIIESDSVPTGYRLFHETNDQ